ncbi:MAG: TonB-dependent receptor [Pseudomonadales bacterium]|nr:TonB-dependent receptor [Pseudomonadales bacterium]
MQDWFTPGFLKVLVFFTLTPVFSFAADEPLAVDEVYSLSLQQLLEVEVTVASAFSESLLQASSSVFVTSKAQWDRQGDQNITDVLSHIPSVVTYSTLGSSTIAIRGFAHSTSVRGVATVLDDVPLNNYAFGSAFYDKINFDLNGLDKIEVIRGPSSSIYGSDSFHGVIALQSYQALQDEVAVNAQLSDEGLYGVNLRTSHALGENHRINLMLGSSAQPDLHLAYNYTEPATLTPKSSEYAYQKQQKTAVLHINSNPGLAYFYDLGLYLNHYESAQNPGIGTHLFEGVSQLQDRDWVDADSEFEMMKLSVGKYFSNDITSTLLSYVVHSELQHLNDLSRLLDYQQLTTNEELKQGLKWEIKQSQNSWATEWVLSFSYDHAEITENNTTFFDENGTPLSLSKDDTSLTHSTDAKGLQRTSRAIALQAKTKVFDEQLIVLYGGRWDDFSDIGAQLTPRLGLIYLPNNHSAVKLLYGRAFRPPTALELSGIGVASGDRDLMPEIIDTLEWVYMLEGKHWRSELLTFYSQWSNGIVIGECKAENNCDSNNYSGQYNNVADNTSHGVEIIIEAEWHHWFSRDSLSYVSSKNDNTGIEYSAFPQWVLNIDVGRQIDTWGSEFYVTNRVYLNMSEGPELNATSGAKSLKHYWRTDFHISKQLGKSSKVYLDVKNLFDRGDFKPALWNNENGLEDLPRSFIVGLDYRL